MKDNILETIDNKNIGALKKFILGKILKKINLKKVSKK